MAAEARATQADAAAERAQDALAAVPPADWLRKWRLVAAGSGVAAALGLGWVLGWVLARFL